jgi:hypothetical protein
VRYRTIEEIALGAPSTAAESRRLMTSKLDLRKHGKGCDGTRSVEGAPDGPCLCDPPKRLDSHQSP